jgi:hypothetical protein
VRHLIVIHLEINLKKDELFYMKQKVINISKFNEVKIEKNAFIF